MNTTPKSLRLQIGIFGRTNAGKSSFLNLVAGQDAAIVSPVPGTTTDTVEKAMELLPIGPVMFLDTAGLDDATELSAARLRKTAAVFERADVFVLVVEAGAWGAFEERAAAEAGRRKAPLILVANKIDLAPLTAQFLERLRAVSPRVIECSCADPGGRERVIRAFKAALIEVCPESFLTQPPIAGDLLPPGGSMVLVVPIDLQAPKGRLILPQVQVIRDALDNDALCLVVKESGLKRALASLQRAPDLVVCDSQVVQRMTAETPPGVKCTTFSILFARFKGDLVSAVRGVCALDRLEAGERILVAEACSHHALEDDIGRVKIPRLIRQYAGRDHPVDVFAGRDYPDNLADYRLVVHCGGCMLTRREMLNRIQKAERAGVALTNYGVCISFAQGVLERVLSPFPAALDAYRRERDSASAIRGARAGTARGRAISLTYNSKTGEQS